ENRFEPGNGGELWQVRERIVAFDQRDDAGKSRRHDTVGIPSPGRVLAVADMSLRHLDQSGRVLRGVDGCQDRFLADGNCLEHVPAEEGALVVAPPRVGRKPDPARRFPGRCAPEHLTRFLPAHGADHLIDADEIEPRVAAELHPFRTSTDEVRADQWAGSGAGQKALQGRSGFSTGHKLYPFFYPCLTSLAVECCTSARASHRAIPWRLDRDRRSASPGG